MSDIFNPSDNKKIKFALKNFHSIMIALMILLSIFTMHWTTASPIKHTLMKHTSIKHSLVKHAPIKRTHSTIYRRNDDVSEDEWEFYKSTEEAARESEEFFQLLQRIKSQSDATDRELEELDYDLSNSDIHDQLTHLINLQPISPLEAVKANPEHDVQNFFEESENESIEFPPDRKRRRISPESEVLTGLKTTGLDLPDASNVANVESSQETEKGENRRFIREIASDLLNDPRKNIKDYDKWLRILINPPNDMKATYSNNMKAKLILKFYIRKIQEKTGIVLNKVPWNQLQEDGIINWEDTNHNVYGLPLERLNAILGRLDQLQLSQEFLTSVIHPHKSGNLESTITQGRLV